MPSDDSFFADIEPDTKGKDLGVVKIDKYSHIS